MLRELILGTIGWKFNMRRNLREADTLREYSTVLLVQVSILDSINSVAGLASSVQRGLDCRSRCHGFDPWGCINTHSLNITVKWHCAPCPANGQTVMWLRWSHKMVVLSPVKGVKIVSSVSTFVPNTGLKILASQRTMSKLMWESTGQLFVLPVMFTIHVRLRWKWNFFQISCCSVVISM